jgi:hypothetical protein
MHLNTKPAQRFDMNHADEACADNGRAGHGHPLFGLFGSSPFSAGRLSGKL